MNYPNLWSGPEWRDSNSSWERRYRMHVDYGNGRVETRDVPSDVIDDHYIFDLTAKRKGTMPHGTVRPYYPTWERIKTFAEWGTWFGAGLLVGGSFVAGFLDRYHVTLAAQNDGLRRAIVDLQEFTKPCVEELPQAITACEQAAGLVARLTDAFKTMPTVAERLAKATAELADAETTKKGVEVCAKLVQYFTQILEPGEKVSEAMAQGGFFEKLKVCLVHHNMDTFWDAWADYSFGEQSLGFLLNVACVLGAGVTAHKVCKALLTDIGNMSEKNASLAAGVAAILAGLYVTTYGGTPKIMLVGGATFLAAKVIGMGIRACKVLRYQ